MKQTLYLLSCIVLVIGSPAHAQIISTYAGNGMSGYSGNGAAATTAKLDTPSCLAVDGAGNIYFTDQLNYCVRKVDTSGIITTIAGTGMPGFTGDGGPATLAKMSDCWGVAVDGSGNIFITDQQYYRVRKVNPSGIINTIAGTGVWGTGGDGGPALSAQLKRPIGIAVDGPGNIYVGDQEAFTIRKISPSGIISTFAGIPGSPGYGGDGGPATNAKFLATYGLATDHAGNVYISDAENNRVRMVNTSGIITTVAGNGVAGFSGDGGTATLCKLDHPTGVFVDGSGNLLIADSHNNRIRKVNTSGIIHTIAGSGTYGFSGDGGLCTTAETAYPTTVTADGKQNIYIADFRNDRIRKITMKLFFAGGHSMNLTLCENSLVHPIDSILTISDAAIGLMDTMSLLSPPLHGIAYVSYITPATGTNTEPTGSYYTPNTGYAGNDTFKVLATNGIATDTITVYVTILPLIHSAGTITGDSSVCAGSTITLADTLAGGVWTISNLNAIVSGGTLTGESAGKDTVTYTVSNTCGAASISKVITINPLPDAGSITGAAELCIGSPVTLEETVAGGVWSVSNSKVSISPDITSCFVTAITAGSDTIVYTVSDTFCAASYFKTLTIDPLPVASVTGGKAGLCVGEAMTLAGTPTGGVWSINNNNASYITGGMGIILTGITPGTDTVNYTFTNFCGTATMSVPFTVYPLPVKPAITRNESTVNVPGGYTTYAWTLNGSAIPGATADSFELTNTGYYGVIVTNSFGCAASSDSINFTGCGVNDITIYPNPAGSTVYINWCKKVNVKLLCMDGRLAGTVRNTNEIDLGNLPNADYLLILYDANWKKITVKYIVKLSR